MCPVSQAVMPMVTPTIEGVIEITTTAGQTERNPFKFVGSKLVSESFPGFIEMYESVR